MIQIGDRRFPTKKAAGADIQKILEKYDVKQPLKGDDDRFMRALLELYPRYGKIAEEGIAYIYVENRDRGRGFAVYHTVDSRRDFSWRACLYRENTFTRLSGVCRKMVRDQITEFRAQHFTGICEFHGDKLRLQDCNVDHIPPATFENLLERWLESVHLHADDIELISSKEYRTPARFADPFLAEQWIEYHEINARLRCVCRDCNQSIIRISPK